MLEFDDAVTAYKELVEKNNDGAMPLLVIDLVDGDPMVVGVQVTDEIRPAMYVTLMADHLRQEGKTIRRMIWQCESWIHTFDVKTGDENGLGEAAVISMRDISGEERMVVIPFVRMNDGVHWQEPQYIDHEKEGDLAEALREAVR